MNTLEIIQNYETDKLFNKIWSEKYEIIAKILVCMRLCKKLSEVSQLFEKLANKTQVEVIEYIAQMKEISPLEFTEIDKILAGQDSVYENGISAGGLETAVELLNLTNYQIERKIFAVLKEKDPELLEKFQRRMFVFEDIVMVDDKSIKEILPVMEDKDIMMALKSVDSAIQDKLFRLMTKERARTIKEGMEFMGPVRLKNLEDAQWKLFKLFSKYFEEFEMCV